MNQTDLHAILKKFDVDTNVRIGPPQSGYRNTSYRVEAEGQLLNLFIYRQGDDVEQIRRSNAVGSYLSAKGVPARHPYDDRILQLTSGTKPKYACIYNYLPGQTIAWESYTRRHLTALGKSLSDLHDALKDYRLSETPHASERQAEVLHTMTQYFDKHGVCDALERKLGLSVSLVPKTTYSLFAKLGLSNNQQLLHMDFVRGNVLFLEARISGILDFEKLSYGHPYFDVARTLAFLRIDCKYKSEAEVNHSFLQSGYQKRGATVLPRIRHNDKDRSMEIIEELVSFFILHDLYKMLRHNPYESLLKNEHFLRARDYLCQRGIITALS